MQLVEINTKGTKELHEIGLGVKGVISAYKKATSDGWQPGQDIPAILIEAYSPLLQAINDADQSKVELQEAPVKAVMGAMIPLAEGVELLLEKDGE